VIVRVVICLMMLGALYAAEHRGVVRFGTIPVPGVVVTASQGNTKVQAVSDAAGAYSFAGLADGEWMVRVEMQMFLPQEQKVVAGPTVLEWKLGIGPVPEVSAKAGFQKAEVAVNRPVKKQAEVPVEVSQQAVDGLLINGSVNNGAASSFAQLPAFGNNRRGQRSLYNGNLGFIVSNALLDARPFSITGQDTPKPGYGRLEGLFAFGGPILRRAWPILTLNYQWTRSTRATTQSGLVPTIEQRSLPIASPQARVLLGLYPLPNFSGNSGFNFQAPLVNGLHQDDLQTRVNKQVKKHFYTGSLAWRSTRTDSPDLLGFLETGRTSGWNGALGYRRSFSSRAFVNLSLQWSRLETDVVPFFSGRRNVSGEAGITGNNQEAVNWGPPSLSFASGIVGLGTAQASSVRNQTTGLVVDGYMNRGRHNITLGLTTRRQQFNNVSQQDARGSFSFTGANDFEKFLRGVPDLSSIAFGNADKYLRGNILEAFVNDDWRVNPGLTINAGVRWEYWSPLREKYGRLVNLEVGRGFATARAVVGDSFLQPDRNNFAPRIGISWRPLAASSMVVRAGYGIYYDTSVYQSISLRMAQQAPLSRSVRISNTPETPLTLANGFSAVGAGLGSLTTFGADPGFRIGYLQNWQASVQRDLPWALQITATYQGSKGTRGQQEVLPNTFPTGAVEPSGFSYLTSNGNSNRHAALMQLRRRLKSGFTSTFTYTFAKSLDNGRLIAQNWLDLSAERSRSNFDQRHLIGLDVQYTSSTRWRLLKDWTVGTQTNTGTGLPLTPVVLRPLVTGSVRPDYTGAPVYLNGVLNPAAFREAVGRWGNAGRNSITGPRQLVVNASVGRAFRSSERVNFDFRLEAANVLNTVTFPSWNTVVGNVQFGLPNAANPMRSVQSIVRVRF
jgi:hypothetical protein